MSELSNEPTLNDQVGTLAGDTPLSGDGATGPLGEVTFSGSGPASVGTGTLPADPMAKLHLQVPKLQQHTTTSVQVNGGGQGEPAPAGSLPENTNTGGLVGFAKKFLGTPYVWGGTSPTGFDCVREDSMVSTPNGPTRIDSIEPGQMVYAWIDGKMVERPAIALVDKGDRESLTIRFRNRKLSCTPNHEVPVMRSERERVGTPVEWRIEWVPASAVQRGDLMVTLAETPDSGETNDLDAETAWFLGLWTGDGHNDNRHVFVCVYDELADRVERFAQSRGIGTHRHPSHGIILNSRALVEWMSSLGLVNGSSKKIVPPAILGAGWKIQDAFCRGYLDADGHIDGKGWWTFNSCNWNLLGQVRSMLMGMRYQTSNLRTTERTKPIVIKGKLVKNALPVHSFQVYPDTKAGNQVALNTFGARRLFGDQHFTCERVLDVSEGEPARMYDIEVAEAHNFIADGVLVHNCSGFVQYVYKHMGVNLPRISADQARAGKRISFADLKPGDLVAIDNSSRNNGADHIGIYVGNGLVINAPRPGRSVQLDRLSAFDGGWGVRLNLPGGGGKRPRHPHRPRNKFDGSL